ncbi:unnamed protein product [Brassicogethes aeneus]|uniref:Peptidase S1 domain-containing protein n=1 Tax=Brassicogethes aeneus TaxID=1431903 RepID=A0A9P0AVG9_BRAAE|nr:unnamed protein product [Brassicogethes aeneus]
MNVYQVSLTIFLACGVQALRCKRLSVPDCGLKHPNLEELRHPKLDYPWHVAIFKNYYKKDLYSCGGTLITPKIVVTAAHCVTLEKGDEITSSPDDFTVFAAKYYLDGDDANVQSSKVRKIIPSEKYQGASSNFGFDIALLVLTKEFKLSKHVQQICRNGSHVVSLKPNLMGVVSGWGKKPDCIETINELQEIHVSIEEDAICQAKLPESCLHFFTDDKFCAKFNQSDVPCLGLSESGLFFKNNDERFYIKGILSTAPRENGTCDHQYALYTNLDEFDSFIDKVCYVLRVRELLDQMVPEQLIRRRRALHWPARSPDLVPLDFFTWGQLKICGVQAISGKLGPDCGLKQTNLEGKSIYPWQVAIFRKLNGEEQFICGGTLLTTKIILTAAHCVTKEKGNDIAVSPEDFTVFAGKSYLDKDETSVQSTKVNKIIPAEYWRGSLQNYAFDLALLILSTEFKLSQGVQMICRDTSNVVSLTPKQIGIVSTHTNIKHFNRFDFRLLVGE